MEIELDIAMMDNSHALRKIAITMYYSENGITNWEDETPQAKAVYYRRAKVALLALRIPPSDIAFGAADKLNDLGKYSAIDGATFVAMWMAAIDKALEDAENLL